MLYLIGFIHLTPFFPHQSAPSQIEREVLEMKLSSNLLNEDVIGMEEIYTQLILRGRRTFQDSVSVARSKVNYF